MVSNEDMVVSAQGSAMAQKGEPLEFLVSLLYLLHWWSFEWRMETNEDIIVSAKGEPMY